MLITPQDADAPLRGDLIISAVLRTDLVPVPASIEIEVMRSTEADKLTEGSTIKVGPAGMEFVLVKVQSGASATIQGDRPVSAVKATGLLKSCAAVAQPLQRAVVMEGQTLGAIYRACGAQVRIDSDFQVQSFACFAGMTPSLMIARVLQEEGGVLVLKDGRVQFRRLKEILQAPAQLTLGQDAGEVLSSSFLERHAVPGVISTDASGAPVKGKTAQGLGFTYRPRADQRVANNMSLALMQRRRVDAGYSPNQNAGDRIDIGGRAHVGITAAHVFEGAGKGAQYSRFWLGELA